MAYSSGSITSATPASALAAVIETELTTHTNWTFVEEVVISTKTYRVWECLGVGNSFGTSFFIFLDYLTTGLGSLLIKGMENWETGGAALNRARRIIPGYGTVAPHATAFTFNDATDYLLDSASFSTYGNLATNTTGFSWQVQASKDRICVSSSVSDQNVYIGLFQSLMAADPFPLGLLGTTSGGFSRLPGVTTAISMNFYALAERYLTYLGYNITLPDAIWGGAVTSPILIRGSAPANGWHRGLLRDVVSIRADGAVTGDTITIGGVTWHCFNIGAIATDMAWVKDTAV